MSRWLRIVTPASRQKTLNDRCRQIFSSFSTIEIVDIRRRVQRTAGSPSKWSGQTGSGREVRSQNSEVRKSSKLKAQRRCKRRKVKMQDPRFTIQEGKVQCILHSESHIIPTFRLKSLGPFAPTKCRLLCYVNTTLRTWRVRLTS